MSIWKKQVHARLGKIGDKTGEEYIIFLDNPHSEALLVTFVVQSAAGEESFTKTVIKGESQLISLARHYGKTKIYRNGAIWQRTNLGLSPFRMPKQLELGEVKWLGTFCTGYFLSLELICVEDMIKELTLKVTQRDNRNGDSKYSESIKLSKGENHSILIPEGVLFQQKGIISGSAILSVGTVFTQFFWLPPLLTGYPKLKILDLVIEDGVVYGKIKLDQSMNLPERVKVAITQSNYIALHVCMSPKNANEEVEFAFPEKDVRKDQRILLMVEGHVIDGVDLPIEKKPPAYLQGFDAKNFIFSSGINTKGLFELNVKWLGPDMLNPVPVEMEEPKSGRQMFSSVFLKHGETDVLTFVGIHSSQWVFVRIGEQVVYFVEATASAVALLA